MLYTIVKYSLIFFVGAIAGYIIEVFFRRFVSRKKWMNPGFLNGPWLPLYGFGLVLLYIICEYVNFPTLPSWLDTVLKMVVITFSMTFIEYIAGLIFIKEMNIKLWDYSNQWGNIQGIICPLFSAIWTGIAALYYFLLAKPILNGLKWFSNNLAFSFVLGVFFGVIVIDYVYSTNLYHKIKKYAKENDIPVKLEELKVSIREHQEKAKEKYSFILPFNQNISLKEHLEKYKKQVSAREKKSLNLFKKQEKKETKNKR